MAGNKTITPKYDFFTGATATAEAIMPVEDYMSTLKLDITTTGTFTVKVYGRISANATFKPIPVFREPDYKNVGSTGITDASYFYIVDLTCYESIKVKIEAITGTLSISGRVVS